MKTEKKKTPTHKKNSVKKESTPNTAHKSLSNSNAKHSDTKTVKNVTAEIVDQHDLTNQNSDDNESPGIHLDNFQINKLDDTEILDADLDNLEHLKELPTENLVVKKKSAKKSVKGSESRGLTSKDPLSLYFDEVRKYPMLSREQELELAKIYYANKDPKIAQQLVTSNLRFVVKIAAEYSRFGARMIDLIQEGNLGLMHAVRDYNPYKGVKLITYAVWWIRGYIQEYLMKQFSLVKIGTTQNQKKLFYQLQRQREEFEALGKTPDIKLLSTTLGIPEDEVKMMTERMSGRDVSLDKTLDDDSTTSLMSLQKSLVTGPDEELSQREEISQLTAVIEKLRPLLSEREKIILDERILNDEPLTLQEIGEKHKITREAVRQMETRVMKKIKDAFAENSAGKKN